MGSRPVSVGRSLPRCCCSSFDTSLRARLSTRLTTFKVKATVRSRGGGRRGGGEYLVHIVSYSVFVERLFVYVFIQICLLK
ncbi:unnamed protein product [Acanthoscelides obtectus]|uniref:Uncharacterized protein n=1 Tax=Acanthoscelides obtectus TaxID=200917 RepID=A0A9P0MEZ9_ACAOB|nr:unnamed protein product [Acanthoscelides obtectus]CAK1635621.1 hypothetical protein AOBTE_LOCUS9393 [Acanthoscelides obtectus]